MKFAIMLEKCNSAEAFGAVVPDHVAYMKQLHERGVLIAGGPFQDGRGGMVLIEAPDAEAAEAIAQADPFIVQGVERCVVRPWEVLTEVLPVLLTVDG